METKQNKKEEKYFDYNVEAWMRFLRSILVFPSFFLFNFFISQKSIDWVVDYVKL